MTARPRLDPLLCALTLGSLLLAAGCDKGRPGAGSRKAARRGAKGEILFSPKIAWEPYERALPAAARSGRPLCVVLYANWCPRCAELAPLFDEEDIQRLARSFHMVRQDTARRPAWLARFTAYGKYVPRVFFLGADGEIRADITSGDDRYPYYYNGSGAHGALKRSMLRALR